MPEKIPGLPVQFHCLFLLIPGTEHIRQMFTGSRQRRDIHAGIVLRQLPIDVQRLPVQRLRLRKAALIRGQQVRQISADARQTRQMGAGLSRFQVPCHPQGLPITFLRLLRVSVPSLQIGQTGAYPGEIPAVGGDSVRRKLAENIQRHREKPLRLLHLLPLFQKIRQVPAGRRQGRSALVFLRQASQDAQGILGMDQVPVSGILRVTSHQEALDFRLFRRSAAVSRTRGFPFPTQLDRRRKFPLPPQERGVRAQNLPLHAVFPRQGGTLLITSPRLPYGTGVDDNDVRLEGVAGETAAHLCQIAPDFLHAAGPDEVHLVHELFRKSQVLPPLPVAQDRQRSLVVSGVQAPPCLPLPPGQGPLRLAFQVGVQSEHGRL